MTGWLTLAAGVPVAQAGGPRIIPEDPPPSGGGCTMVSVHTAEWTNQTCALAIEPANVYVWPQSVTPGQTISIYVSSINSPVTIRFLHAGATETPTGVEIQHVATTDQLVCAHVEPDQDTGVWSTGCNWNVTRTFQIPSNWASGLYYVQIERETGADLWLRAVAPFVVRGDPATGPRPPIAVVFATSTSWAYEGWGGRSTYTAIFDCQYPYGTSRTHLSSLCRPTINAEGRGLIKFDLPWVRFLAVNPQVNVDYLTMEDIHTGGLALLQNYQELVFIGHSEYWSAAQRSAVEAFIAAGGNVFFPSGNVCFGRIKYSADGKTLIAYKANDAGTGAYPAPNDDTWQWEMPPINNPANSMTGVDWVVRGTGMLGATNSRWTVRDASVSWIFAGTNLANGDVMGGTRLDGDEVDGVELDWTGTPGAPTSTPSVSSWSVGRGTDPSFHIFATCEARDISGPSYEEHPLWGVAGFYQRPGQGMVVALPQESVGQELWPMTGDYGERIPIENDTLLATVVLNVMDHLASPLNHAEARKPTDALPAVPSLAVHAPNPVRVDPREGLTLLAHSAVAAPYRLEILSVLGQHIGDTSGRLTAGDNVLRWRPDRAQAAGVYFWKLSTEQTRLRGRLVVLP